jgi:hypothetical protein
MGESKESKACNILVSTRKERSIKVKIKWILKHCHQLAENGEKYSRLSIEGGSHWDFLSKLIW